MLQSMKLTVSPKWEEIEKARAKSTEFLKVQGLEDETVYTVTMVISELIENSIKYGTFDSPESKITMCIEIGPQLLTVEVINPVNETSEYHLNRLDKTIQWIRGHQDPFEAYIERVKEVSKKPLRDPESGLGLVRIAYEGKATLDFFVNEDNNLSVSALSNL